VRDLKEVLENPLPDVLALPLNDNLYLWHGNVRSAEGCLDGVNVHFVLQFPSDYPAHAPEVRLFSPVPHPNVHHWPVPDSRELRAAQWRLSIWDCLPTKDAWSPAYSVLAILVQLQAFLLHEELQYDTNTVANTLTAIARAQEVQCPSCSHTHKAPVPAFHTHPSCLRPRPLLISRPLIQCRSRATAQQG
jgi:ubiquitin-protein ligase